MLISIWILASYSYASWYLWTNTIDICELWCRHFLRQLPAFDSIILYLEISAKKMLKHFKDIWIKYVHHYIICDTENPTFINGEIVKYIIAHAFIHLNTMQYKNDVYICKAFTECMCIWMNEIFTIIFMEQKRIAKQWVF